MTLGKCLITDIFFLNLTYSKKSFTERACVSNKLMIPRKVTKNEQTTNEQIYERYLGEHLQTVSCLSLDKKSKEINNFQPTARSEFLIVFTNRI